LNRGRTAALIADPRTSVPPVRDGTPSRLCARRELFSATTCALFEVSAIPGQGNFRPNQYQIGGESNGHFETDNSADEKVISLFMRTTWQLSSLFLGAILVCGPASGWCEPSSPIQDSGAKQDMKDAGHDTKEAARDTGHGVKQGTKKAYHKTKNGTKKAYHKTKNTATGAAHGAKEGAKQPE